MAKSILKTIKGKKYVYLEESVRVGEIVRKVSEYIGPDKKITNKDVYEGKKLLKREH